MAGRRAVLKIFMKMGPIHDVHNAARRTHVCVLEGLTKW